MMKFVLLILISFVLMNVADSLPMPQRKLPDGCKKKKDCTIDPLSDVDQEDFVRKCY
uniref:Uncharacterized protein n=1 Tax=Magallana gigas TaxID=29159 RepID=K1PPG3_MAGGI